jgi:hypothetical protein
MINSIIYLSENFSKSGFVDKSLDDAGAAGFILTELWKRVQGNGVECTNNFNLIFFNFCSFHFDNQP